jgi:tetratricopeptide (TPR) repeat protein
MANRPKPEDRLASHPEKRNHVTLTQADRVKPRQQVVAQAIQQAQDGNWEAAIETNQFLIERYGADEATLNRLGKALSEVGRLEDALAAYQKALAVNPLNTIAQRNVPRLQLLAERAAEIQPAQVADATLFIEEMGRTALTTLHFPKGSEVQFLVSPGDPVELVLSEDPEGGVEVRTAGGVTIGELEFKLGQRLRRFIEGGNRYAAAIVSVEEGSCRVMLREIYQHPDMAGRLSFPTKKHRDEVRPYVKEGLLGMDFDPTKYDEDDAEVEELEGMHQVEADEAAELVDTSSDDLDKDELY